MHLARVGLLCYRLGQSSNIACARRGAALHSRLVWPAELLWSGCMHNLHASGLAGSCCAVLCDQSKGMPMPSHGMCWDTVPHCGTGSAGVWAAALLVSASSSCCRHPCMHQDLSLGLLLLLLLRIRVGAEQPACSLAESRSCGGWLAVVAPCSSLLRCKEATSVELRHIRWLLQMPCPR